MVDKVKPLKLESSVDGTEDDFNYTETDPTEDYIAAKGIAFENSNVRRIDLDASGDTQFTDVSNPTGKTLKAIQQDISDKYPASNPTGYETPAQLNARDTANRDRANHTGTQLAATISNFAATVLATLLAGLSTATNAAIVSGDSIIIALGKAQAQINAVIVSIGLKYDASNPSGFETPTQLNTRDTNNRARANHTGTQLANTVSNFAATVLATVLTGLSTATSTAIVATDSILTALGKAQAQINTTAASLSAHIGSGGASHANATTSVSGFMTGTDKTKLDALFVTTPTFSSFSDINFNTNSTTMISVTGTLITPNVAGTYIASAVFVASVNTNTNRTIEAQLFKNSTLIVGAEASSQNNVSNILRSNTLLSPTFAMNGTTDTIDLRVSITGNTLTVGDRILVITRIGP
jgi:hypothetical protein